MATLFASEIPSFSAAACVPSICGSDMFSKEAFFLFLKRYKDPEYKVRPTKENP